MSRIACLSVATLGMAAAGIALPGCTGSGIGKRIGLNVGEVRVENLTNRIVKVELVAIDRNNNPKIYATQLLAMEAEFQYGAGNSQRFPGMRARFSLAEDANNPGGADNVNVVQLGMPEDGVRQYELRIVNGRLTAKEVGIEAGRRKR